MNPFEFIFKFLQPRDCLAPFGVSLGGFHSRWVLVVIVQPAILCLLVWIAYAVRPDQVDVRGALFLIMFFCYPSMNSVSMVSDHDIAVIWVAFFSRCQRYCC